ncbi:hypothetical protein ED733_000742 [Metarhizium rileyi]|uniref:Uncharacterized protein n=1 Tax=Metarhizium rileyi (strain RCEF 4871) TaxID=1649241 RepID=A0A5C6G891_METRR|nr:hypothetical protein ED733_000742 [Metarhizium rileyi]
MDRNPSFQWDSVKVGKSGTCRSFERTGTCKFGKRCRYQHEATSAATSFFNNGLGDSTPRIHGKLREWKQLLSNGGTISRLSAAVVSRFFQLGLELMSGDVGSSQEVIKRLASDEGLPFVKVVVEKHLAVAIETGPGITFWTTELKPLFQLITHPRVIDSSVLEQEVVTVFNFILGVGGARMNRLFEYLVQLTTLWPDQTTDSTRMSAFADIVATGPDELEKFASLQSAKYIDYIRRRLQVGYDIPEMSSLPRVSVLREEFVSHRDLPGTLSAEGPRHDNDFADMSKISILPTCEEIMSPRAEYLPTKDSSQWHIAGIRGRLDREFRLLREDTVGQLRDTPDMYEDPVLMKVDFSRNDGIELKVRCQQLPAVVKLTKTQREEWWQRSRRLQAGALVCVIDVSGLVQFFVVSRSTIRSQNETRFSSKKDKTASNPEKEDQQPACTLSDDANYLFVTLQLVDSEAEAVKEVLQWYGAVRTNRQRYLVEFPGVILDSFRHTLAALQQMYRKQDMPFSDILAPAAEAGAAVDIEPALYARKPMFKFDLGCLKDELMVSPANIPDPAELALVSSLDLTQAAAVLNTLSRKISLIQGPPGTGKSYTGEKIIQVLLGNKKAANLGPVLCVCYTNHALDQLLDHLLDAGVDGVIRIGSRSKSEKLVNLNLQSIVKQFEKTKSESAKLGKAEGGIKHVVQQVGDHLRRLEACGSWSALKEHLQEYYPQQYKSFEPVEEEDGWIQVMRRKPEERFTNWLQTGENTAVAPRAISILEQSDVWEMSRPEKDALFRHWMKRIRDPVISSIARLHQEYSGHIEERSKVANDLRLRCLQQANVIGVTTTGLAKNVNILGRLRSKVMLCEEAGEVLEAHILTALIPSLEHAILIGDHLQLRPQINNHELQGSNPRGSQYALDMSLFERLVIPPYETDPRLPFSSLETQRRMHPSISALIRPTLYPDLDDSAEVHTYPEVVGMKKRLFWFHHERLEAGAAAHDPLTTTHSNDFEVEMTTALVSHLVRQGEYHKGQIAVLTPYLGQLHKLRNRMSSIFEIFLDDRDQDELATLEADAPLGSKSSSKNVAKSSLLQTIRIATVDNFQGEEAEVIVISLVRSNTQSRCGFLSTSNRINVLLSRAKHGMYIVGNANTYKNVSMWNEVIGIMETGGNIGTSLELQCPRHPDTPILSCAVEDVKSACVDFLEMKEYRDIDLDQDPCIFPDCGHFLTMTSMDGQMDMTSHYDMDANGVPTSIHKESEPFSMDGSGVKTCASCRGSLRNIARYGRIVRRAILDEATKKFISWSNKQYGLLSSRFLNEHATLSGADVLDTATTRAKPGRPRHTILRFSYIGCLERQISSQRYGELLRMWTGIRRFANDVKVDEQPFQQVADLVRHANRLHQTKKKFRFDETVIQVKGYLLACTLLLKCEMAILSDFFVRCRGKAWLPAEFALDLTQQFRDCEEVIGLARKSVHPKELVQALIFEAQLCAVSVTVDACSVPPGLEGGAVTDKEAVRAYGFALLERATEMSRLYPSTAIFADEIDAVASSLNGSFQALTEEEMRDVVEAMVGDVGSGGRWYVCENGHPFTIGECGRPMEEARCSECDARVGGRNHVMVNGVDVATDLNRIAREMEEMEL